MCDLMKISCEGTDLLVTHHNLQQSYNRLLQKESQKTCPLFGSF